MTSDWRLIGRDDELAAIERCRGAGERAVVLAGVAGVGKSRLAGEALAQAARQGASTRWVQGTRSAATVPLGALAGLLPDAARSEDPLERLRLGVRLLSEHGDGRGLVLAVDDAHLLDASSAALVLELVLGASAFVVVTVRAGEPCPDAVAALWKDAGATRFELAALTRAQTESLAEEITGGPIEQSARRWIYDTSLGNALYVRELIRGALSGGALVETHGLWRMAQRPIITASLTELIAARMAGLRREPTRALELLALAEPLPMGELIVATGAEALADIESRGLVTVSDSTDSAQVTLSHPLYGEVVRAALPAFRRRQIQLGLAESFGRRDEIDARDLLRMAQWLIEGGREMPNAVLLQAGAVANLSGDPELGAELAARALAAGAGTQAALLLARARILQSRYVEAEEVLVAAEPDLADRASAVEYLEQRTTVLLWGLRRPEELRALLARARSWWDDPEWRDRLDTLRLVGHDVPSPSAAASASARIYEDEGTPPDVRRRIAPMHAFNLFLSGQVRRAYDLALTLRTAAPLRDLTDELGYALWSFIAIESGWGWAELERWASAGLADAIRLGDRAAAGRAALALGGLRFSQGRFLEAGRWLGEAELQLERRDSGGLLAIVNSMQVGVACFTGDRAAIEPALERCRAATGSGDPLPNQLPYAVRAEAWARRAQGDPPHAQALLLDAAARLQDMPVYAGRLTYEALRAGARGRRVAPSLQSLARRCDARLTAAYAAHATALGAGDADGLIAVADEMESIGALRYATEASADAAAAYLAGGRHDAARRAAVRSHGLHGLGDGGVAPVVAGLDPGTVALTPREGQIVELAQRGLSNAQIAERLVLSTRTVESHLYRAMGKLGVRTRRDLPDASPTISAGAQGAARRMPGRAAREYI